MAALILLIALNLGGAAPQTPPAVATGPLPDDTMARCELHVWPAEGFFGIPFSMGGVLFRGRASRKDIEGAMEELLSPAAQLAALREADPIRELRLPADTRLVEHEQPLDPKTVNKVKSRRAQSSSPCYYELIMTGHLLVEDIVWGDRFSSDFTFRPFIDKTEVKQRLGGTGGNKLKVLTLSEGSRPVDTTQLVAAAVRANFREYANNVRRRMAAKSSAASR